MKNFEGKMYRDGLAESLKELRKNEGDGREKARQFLALSKETSLYNKAKEEQRPKKVNEENGKLEQMSIEKKESELVEFLVELIENHPSVVYQISANGNIEGNGPGIGQFSYRFDKNEKEFKRTNFNDRRIPDPNFYDSTMDGTESNTDLSVNKVNIFVNDRGELLEYKLGIKFKRTKNNSFTSETRGDLVLSSNIIFKNDENFRQLWKENKELRELFSIEKRNSYESKAIMWKVFQECFNRYLSGYWRYVLQEIRPSENK